MVKSDDMTITLSVSRFLVSRLPAKAVDIESLKRVNRLASRRKCRRAAKRARERPRHVSQLRGQGDERTVV